MQSIFKALVLFINVLLEHLSTMLVLVFLSTSISSWFSKLQVPFSRNSNPKCVDSCFSPKLPSKLVTFVYPAIKCFQSLSFFPHVAIEICLCPSVPQKGSLYSSFPSSGLKSGSSFHFRKQASSHSVYPCFPQGTAYGELPSALSSPLHPIYFSIYLSTYLFLFHLSVCLSSVCIYHLIYLPIISIIILSGFLLFHCVNCTIICLTDLIDDLEYC